MTKDEPIVPPSLAAKLERYRNDPRLQFFIKGMQAHRQELDRISDPALRSETAQAVIQTYTAWFARQDTDPAAYDACVGKARAIISRAQTHH